MYNVTVINVPYIFLFQKTPLPSA